MIKTLVTVLIAAAMAAAASAPVFAHEDREAGEYRLVVGFMFEPAYEGEKNAISLRVTREGEHHEVNTEDEGHHATEAGEEGDGQSAPILVGVEGVQNSLQVEVTHVPSNATKTMSLRAVFNEPGHYAADLIPTSPGHYRFRFFGKIDDEPLDAVFDSRAGGGDFDDVQVASAIHFPQPVASVRELESVIRGVQKTAQQAQTAADDSSGVTLGIIGIVLGALGTAIGGGAVLMTARNRNT